MQGVVKVFDPVSRYGVVICETDLEEYELAPDAFDHSMFRMLRQGQRVIFDLDERNLASRLRLGSEADMGTPGFAADPTAAPGSASQGSEPSP